MIDQPKLRQPLIVRLIAALAYVPADLYGIILTPLLLLWVIIREDFWLTRLLANVMPGAFYPLVLTIIIGVLLRRRFTLALQIVPVLFFIILYSPVFLPHTVQATEGQQLRVMTYNILYLNTDITDTLQIIRDASPDIITMQEVKAAFNEQLQAELQDEYPYWVWQMRGAAGWGRLTISRYPITDEAVLANDFGQIIYLATDIDINGTIIRVYNMHLTRPRLASNFSTRTRTESITTFLTELRTNNVPMPFIVMGDFNMSDTTADYRRLNNAFKDAYRESSSGLGTTFENYGDLGFGFIPQLVRLDYVFLRDGVNNQQLIPISSRVLNTGSSDHLPVVVDLVIEEN